MVAYIYRTLGDAPIVRLQRGGLVQDSILPCSASSGPWLRLSRRRHDPDSFSWAFTGFRAERPDFVRVVCFSLGCLQGGLGIQGARVQGFRVQGISMFQCRLEMLWRPSCRRRYLQSPPSSWFNQTAACQHGIWMGEWAPSSPFSRERRVPYQPSRHTQKIDTPPAKACRGLVDACLPLASNSWLCSVACLVLRRNRGVQGRLHTHIHSPSSAGLTVVRCTL